MKTVKKILFILYSIANSPRGRLAERGCGPCEGPPDDGIEDFNQLDFDVTDFQTD